jgi:hypothetical protein
VSSVWQRAAPKPSITHVYRAALNPVGQRTAHPHRSLMRVGLPQDFKPRFGFKNFFSARTSLLFLLPLVITFLPAHCHYLFSTTTNERTNERTSERTNER